VSRFSIPRLSQKQLAKLEVLISKFESLESEINKIAPSRSRSVVATKLDEAFDWSIRALVEEDN
jgi:hypothetical protein